MLTKTILSAASFILGASVLTGCTSTARPTNDAQASTAMMCPKCETVWVRHVTGQGTKTQSFSSDKKMICPDCDNTARAYLEGDKAVLHNCPTCKVTPQVVTPTEASHPKGPRSS